MKFNTTKSLFRVRKVIGFTLTVILLFAFLVSTASAQEVKKLPARDEIDKKYKWRLDDVYATDEFWEKDFLKAKNILDQFKRYEGTLDETAQNLLECLELDNQVGEILGKLYWYAARRNDENMADQTYQAMRDRIASLYSEVGQATAFIDPEITAIPEAKLWDFVERNEKLEVYRHYFEDLVRSKAHILPPEQEEILAMAGEVTRGPYQIFNMFNNADIKFPSIVDEDGNEVEVTKGRFFSFMRSSDRRVRQDAFDALYTEYNKWSNTLAALLGSQIKRDIFYAKTRKYDSSLESSLDAGNIPVAVYNNLISTINDYLEPMHKFMSLRKRMMKLDELHSYDLYVPLLPKLKKEIPYEEAMNLLEKGLQPLGPQYIRDLKTGFKSGWVDVYENQGKRSGAYSSYVYGAHPVILMNYDNELDDVFTLAHEMGHALHSYYTGNTQPYIYGDYSIFVAEVASTVNEALLMDYLLKTTVDRDEKLYLLNQYIDNIRGTVYIQVLFAEFEKTVHERVEAGEALTTREFNAIMKDLYQKYYGPDFVMDEMYELNWARIPHFYRTFYVYQYATGLSAGEALAQKILAGDTETLDRYLSFLASGSSDYSINVLKDAGVDMTSPEPVEAVAKLMGRLVDEMDTLLQE
ncbi:MAG: oligoendopeptidase F [Gemmatimonadota bacterium]|nr:MAG: oligoendopeptidase F [Gemmatimonadota bacterium]